MLDVRTRADKIHHHNALFAQISAVTRIYQELRNRHLTRSVAIADLEALIANDMKPVRSAKASHHYFCYFPFLILFLAASTR